MKRSAALISLLVLAATLGTFVSKHVRAAKIFDRGFEELAQHDLFFRGKQVDSVRRAVHFDRLRLLSSADAQALLRRVLTDIGDRHGFLMAGAGGGQPGVSRPSAGIMLMGGGYIVGFTDPAVAAQSGLVRGDRVISIDGVSTDNLGRLWTHQTGARPREFLVESGGARRHLLLTSKARPTDLMPYAYRLSPFTSYMLLPGDQFNFSFGAEDLNAENRYVTRNLNALNSVVRPGLCGLILDLRLNTGGFLAPQARTVSSVFGSGWYGYFLSSGQPAQRQWWGVDPNGVAYNQMGGSSDGFKYSQAGLENQAVSVPRTWTAVLIGAWTASAGEAVAIASKSYSKSVLIGERTYGVTTGLAGVQLPGHVGLAYSYSYMYDSRGQIYKNGLAPDVPARTDWSVFGTINDPPVRAAVDWFRQKGCKS